MLNSLYEEYKKEFLYVTSVTSPTRRTARDYWTHSASYIYTYMAHIAAEWHAAAHITDFSLWGRIVKFDGLGYNRLRGHARARSRAKQWRFCFWLRLYQFRWLNGVGHQFGQIVRRFTNDHHSIPD